MKTITVAEAYTMLQKRDSKQDLLEGLLDGRYCFPQDCVKVKSKLGWCGWRPYIANVVVISDGTYELRIEDAV